ncbi:hypothetical protein KR009_009917 [Drosophila setifemur]|nr:hypothetical protein KR009_009917 [Drosophila setifemur]
MRWQLLILWLGLVASAPVGKWRRQVVAPTWLQGPTLPLSPQASQVVVTPQKLREVAAWRAQIQKAVNEDTFAVAAAPSREFLSSLGGPAPVVFQPWTPPTFNFTLSFWPQLG